VISHDFDPVAILVSMETLSFAFVDMTIQQSNLGAEMTIPFLKVLDMEGISS
jgi:hypothetical protein